jgi:PKD repeat protein
MTRIRILILLPLIFLCAFEASAVTVYLSGTITDLQGINPVSGHTVYVKTDFSSPFHYYKTVYTDSYGHYADTVQNVPAYPVLFEISTYDCDNVAHQLTGLSTNSPIVSNFQICVPPYSGCLADFVYDSISGLNYKFTDHSVSNSNIIAWNWIFGDPASGAGNTSSLKDPAHLYTSAGIYNVKLLITASNGCKDSVMKTVFIHIALDQVIIHGHVFNILNNKPIPGNPIEINAILMEYSDVVYSDTNGYYADTIASIYDGIPISVATYDCDNVLQSNTVYSTNTPIEVNFSICLNEQCRAAFSAVLDSNNRVQNTFVFTDLSYGDHNNWNWTFGDGASSSEQNPVHQYTTDGTFKVELTITKMDSTGAWDCFDSISSFVKTSAYYNLGGLLFAGKFPINNPHDSKDTGIVYLYRAHNKWIVPVDSNRFTYMGYYTFLHVLEGNYIIKAGLTEGSSQFKEYLPAYNGSQCKWQTTSPFSLDHTIFDNDIYLIAGNDSLSGSARIRGSVIFSADTSVLPNAEVLLLNDDLVPIKATYSDASGNFEFPALPFGIYNLYPEVTGKYSKVVQVSVDTSNPVSEGLKLEVFEHEVTGIASSHNKSGFIFGRIYPNPGTAYFQLWAFSPETLEVTAELIALTGELMLSKNIEIVQGNNLLTIPLPNMPSGMYFVVIRSGDGRIINTQKIIKN